MNRSAELIDSFKLLRSLNYSKEPGMSGIIIRTSSEAERHIKNETERITRIWLFRAIDIVFLFYKNFNFIIFKLSILY